VPTTWAIDGLDLYLDVVGGRPRRRIEDALRAAVADGRLAPGTRLPASRTVAGDLGVARNTVAEAYAQLAAEGWLVSRVGAGTWVGDRAVPGSAPAAPPGPPALPGDLRGGIPDVTAFPRREWAAAARRAALDSPARAFGYPDPRGVPEARVELAGYLARTRGVRCGGDDVVLTAGFGALLAAVCRVLAARGARRLAVEAYGHERHRRVVAAAGLEVVPVPVDAAGLDVARLADLDVSGVLLTPAHQFPTGVPLAAARRVALTRWAERTGAVVVEDDYDGEFRYDRRAVGALQALAPAHVLYAGTASKSVGPGVGLAWGVLPTGLAAPVAEQAALLGGAPGALDQLTLAARVRAHDLDRSVRRLRRHYRRRRELVDAAVTDRLPGCRASGLAAGLHCLVELPPGTEEPAVTAAAARRGVRLEGLGTYAAAPGAATHRPAVVIGYGAPAGHAFEATLEAAVAAIAEVTG
jgi:GntR family transcriptional regulator/MocR family aminotransferase